MKILSGLALVTTVGLLAGGCREDAVGPSVNHGSAVSYVDTLSKHGMSGGDTLSGGSETRPIVPGLEGDPGVALHNGDSQVGQQGSGSRDD